MKLIKRKSKDSIKENTGLLSQSISYNETIGIT